MNKFSKLKSISFLSLFFFLFQIIVPSWGLASDTSKWDYGGQSIGEGPVRTQAPPADNQLPDPPKEECIKGAEPIFLQSGEFQYVQDDLMIPSRAMNIELRQTYNSGKNISNAFGYGWSFSYFIKLRPLDNGNVVIISPDGRRDEYTANGSSFISPPGFYDTLVKNQDGTWTLTKEHGDQNIFDMNGNLSVMRDRNNNQMTFTYDPQGALPIIGVSPYSQISGERLVIGYEYRLTQITDTVGRAVNLSYNSDGRLQTMTDFSGRTIKLGYDSNDNLTTFTKPATPEYPEGLTTTYGYDSNHHLTTITDAKNQTYLTNHYDASNRVIDQDYGTGTFHMAYQGDTTTITDRKGYVTTWTFDSNGNPSKKEEFTQGLRPTDPVSFITNFTHNNNFKRTSATYPKGTGVKYIYDSQDTVLNDVEFNTNGSGEGWYPASCLSSFDVSAGTLKTQVLCADPYMYYAPYLSFAALPSQKIKIRYRSTTDTKAAFYWYSSNGYFSENNSYQFNIIGDGQFHSYTLDVGTNPNWSGTIYQLRFDPVQEQTSGDIEIDYIQIVNVNTSPKAGNLLEVRKKADMSASDSDTNDIVAHLTYESRFNFPKTVTDPIGNVTTYTYDYELNPLDPRYGDAGNLATITYPEVAGQIAQVNFTYNQYGQLTEQVDPNGHETSFEYYSDTGYLKAVVQDPSGINARTEFTFDSVGNPVSMKDPNGNVLSNAYNALNWLMQATDALGFYVNYSYDQNGNVTKQERKIGTGWQTTRYAYNIVDKLTSITDPLNRITNIAYDLNDNQSSITDALNHATTYDYDERNLLWKVTDANSPSGVTEYSYDTNGNPSQIKDAKSNPTDYLYDNFDRLSKMTYADNSFSQYSYDKDSNLTEHDTPSTYAIQYTYDALNRLINKHYPSTPNIDVDYGYDIGSRLSSVTSPQSSANYSYDNLNRILSAAQTLNSNPYALTYEYDKAGNRTRVLYPSNKDVHYSYDKKNRLSQVTADNATLVTYTYDALDRRIQKNLYGTKTGRTDYSYDLANQLLSLKNYAVTPKQIPPPDIQQLGLNLLKSLMTPRDAEAQGLPALNSLFSYTYDQIGNRLTMTAPNGIHNYTYNNIYELTGVSGAQTHAFNYDTLGNRTTADSANYTSNSLNQYTQVAAIPYSYDGNGNLTSDGISAYTYDAENRMVSAPNTSYAYDGFGRRISKTVGGTTTYFVYDSDRIAEERDAGGTLIASYVYGEGIDEVLTMNRNSTAYYYFMDGLGSVTDITNGNGEVVENYSYDVYGAPNHVSSIGNPYMFTGRQYDDESGLYYYRARMYSPAIGRFLQRDPIGYYDSMNLFQYTKNNSVNYVDPSGEVIPLPLVTGLIGGVASAIGNTAIQAYNNGGFNNFNLGELGVATGVGFAAGAAAPFVVATTLGAAALGGVANIINYSINHFLNNQPMTAGGLVLNTAIGVFGGAVGGVVTRGVGIRFEENSPWLDQAIAKALNNTADIIANTRLSNLLRSSLAGLLSSFEQPEHSSNCNR